MAGSKTFNVQNNDLCEIVADSKGSVKVAVVSKSKKQSVVQHDESLIVIDAVLPYGNYTLTQSDDEHQVILTAIPVKTTKKPIASGCNIVRKSV